MIVFTAAGLLAMALAAGSLAAPIAADTSLQPLMGRLSSPDASERAEAACSLGQRGPAAAPAVSQLVALLPDALRVGPVECGMSAWLRKTIESRPDEWRKFETSPGREAAKALARIGRPALAPLLTALQAESPIARGNAAFAIGEMEPREGRAEALGRLMQALKDDDAGVREACARALGEIEDPEAVPALLASVRDKAAPVRATSAWALGEIEDLRAVEPLVRTLWDADADVRSQAAWALGELEDPRGVEGLMGALAKDTDRRVRRQAAWALGEIEDRRAVSGLMGALGDGDARVRQQAAWALGEIADPSAASSLARALKDASAEVRRQAAWALGELKSGE
jgi:HEAT repeat protein